MELEFKSTHGMVIISLDRDSIAQFVLDNPNATKIDIEPVIRCKECLYFLDDGDGLFSCSDNAFSVKPNDFCCWGERK